MHKILMFVVCLISTVAIAEGIYHWVDEEGNSHFGDTYFPGAKSVELADDKPDAKQVESHRARQQVLQDVVTQQAAERKFREQRLAKEQAQQAKRRMKEKQQCLKLRDQLSAAESRWSTKRRQGYSAEDKRSFIARRNDLRERISSSCN